MGKMRIGEARMKENNMISVKTRKSAADSTGNEYMRKALFSGIVPSDDLVGKLIGRCVNFQTNAWFMEELREEDNIVKVVKMLKADEDGVIKINKKGTDLILTFESLIVKRGSSKKRLCKFYSNLPHDSNSYIIECRVWGAELVMRNREFLDGFSKEELIDFMITGKSLGDIRLDVSIKEEL
jgi:hypothetical protein